MILLGNNVVKAVTVSVGLESFIEVAVISKQCSQKNSIDLIIQKYFALHI